MKFLREKKTIGSKDLVNLLNKKLSKAKRCFAKIKYELKLIFFPKEQKKRDTEMKMVMMMVMVIMMSVIEKIKYEQRKFKYFQMINYYLSIGNRIFIRCKHFMGIVGQRRTWRDWCSSCELTTTTTTTLGNRKQKTVIIIKCCTHTPEILHTIFQECHAATLESIR